MKKSFLFGLLAAALGLSACNTEDEIANETTAQKGMILHATVAQSTNTRATITIPAQDAETDDWTFAFTDGDKIEVTNDIDSDTCTFTKNGDSFVSTNAQPTSEPTTWYASYPSMSVELTNQSGTIEDVAKHYLLYGEIDDETGENGLTVKLSPKSAILKIVNKKGSIDLALKNTTLEDVWVLGISSYSMDIGPTRESIFSTTETGTYYIVVPVDMNYDIYDGDTKLKSISGGLQAGKYYTLTINKNPIEDANLIQGVFSVSDTKQVQFTKGNLYWDGSNYQLENNQTDFPTEWNANHVGHFYWTTWEDYNISTASYKPYDYCYSFTSQSGNEEFWCNEKHPITIGNTSDLYTLSKDEWNYLINTRPKNLMKLNVNVMGVEKNMVLAPDGYSGTIADSYDKDAWKIAEDKGFVCLPMTGLRFTYNQSYMRFQLDGPSGYWTSTQHYAGRSYLLQFTTDLIYDFSSGIELDNAFSIRLVKTVE